MEAWQSRVSLSAFKRPQPQSAFPRTDSRRGHSRHALRSFDAKSDADRVLSFPRERVPALLVPDSQLQLPKMTPGCQPPAGSRRRRPRAMTQPTDSRVASPHKPLQQLSPCAQSWPPLAFGGASAGACARRSPRPSRVRDPAVSTLALIQAAVQANTAASCIQAVHRGKTTRRRLAQLNRSDSTPCGGRIGISDAPKKPSEIGHRKAPFFGRVKLSTTQCQRRRADSACSSMTSSVDDDRPEEPANEPSSQRHTEAITHGWGTQWTGARRRKIRSLAKMTIAIGFRDGKHVNVRESKILGLLVPLLPRYLGSSTVAVQSLQG
jgi:hypothetical protein